MRKLTIGIAAAAGFILGSRSGRGPYKAFQREVDRLGKGLGSSDAGHESVGSSPHGSISDQRGPTSAGSDPWPSQVAS